MEQQRAQPNVADAEALAFRKKWRPRPAHWAVAIVLCFGIGVAIPSPLFRRDAPPAPLSAEQALRLQSGVNLARALQFFEQKAYGVAISEAQSCVQLDATNAGCHRLLGQIFEKLGHSQDATDEYRKFLALTAPEDLEYRRVKLTVFALEHPVTPR